ncbi:MAG: hypothetical protein HXO50_10205 [Prevotella sp.]|nr:hypothetical protein [Prevotella sp.]
MKRKQLERLGYLKPECEIIETITEQFVCASVRPDAGASTTPSSTAYENKGTHDVGTVFFGDPSTVAPAKQGFLWDEEEKDF